MGGYDLVVLMLTVVIPIHDDTALPQQPALRLPKAHEHDRREVWSYRASGRVAARRYASPPTPPTFPDALCLQASAALLPPSPSLLHNEPNVATNSTANLEGSPRRLPSGYDDVSFYLGASKKLVGALFLESLGFGAWHTGESVTGHGPRPRGVATARALPSPPALPKHCEDDSGVSTYAYNGLAGQWSAQPPILQGEALERHDNPARASGAHPLHPRNVKLHSGQRPAGRHDVRRPPVLPDGPGGRAFFDITYVADLSDDDDG